MTQVLVQTHGTQISARAGRLILESPDKGAKKCKQAGEVQSIPLEHITELHIVGYARISTAALFDLAERGVTVFLQRYPHTLPLFVVQPAEGHLAALQAQFLADAEHRRKAAQMLVLGKVQNCNWVLTRLKHSTRLGTNHILLSNGDEQLRGMEGHAARLYFAALSELTAGWHFRGRVYHPPTDPVNSALSFAYAVLLRLCIRAILQAGLHPAFGTFHVPHGKRPALALDVMEPFRAPLCDLTVLTLLRRGELTPKMFAPAPQHTGGLWLQQDGRQLLMQALQARLEQWEIHKALAQQVQAVQRVWQGQEAEPWQPPARP